jgi:hypothetical protein
MLDVLLFLVASWFPPPADSIRLSFEYTGRRKILPCRASCRQKSSRIRVD